MASVQHVKPNAEPVVDDEFDDERLATIVPGASVILCADDFAMTAGVSRGITELAHARRLSATSAIVTMPGWAQEARGLRDLRAYIAAGLHLNLTLGRPLGEMRDLAPDGELPANVDLVRKALSLSLDMAEVQAEIERQLIAFEDGVGFPPDFIDGHQHVHALPVVRAALVEVLARRFPGGKPLVRDPADRWSAILRRGAVIHKAAAISLLACGFGERARQAGFPTNHGFAGVSAFNPKQAYALELASAFRMRGPRHLVMCHPGYVDEALAELDPVVERRRQEFDTLFALPRLDSAIWRVNRRADGPPIDWQGALPT